MRVTIGLIIGLAIVHHGYANDCKNGEDCFQQADAAMKAGDFERSFTLAKSACDDHQHALSCSSIGTMYLRGIGVEKDFKLSTQYLKQACDQGNQDGCVVLGSVYANGNLGLEQDNAKAVEIAKTGCQQDHPASCFLLAQLQQRGQGIEMDKKAAEQNFNHACQSDKRFCKQPAA